MDNPGLETSKYKDTTKSFDRSNPRQNRGSLPGHPEFSGRHGYDTISEDACDRVIFKIFRGYVGHTGKAVEEKREDWLTQLNPKQLEAVTAPPGPVLVLAGPGSGKTRVLTYRVAYLIRELGIPPFRLLAVTFTNKAANEMRERIISLLGGAPRGLTVGTFHSICARFLRRDGAVLGVPPDFVIYDDSDRLGVIKNALKEIGLDDRLYPPRQISSFISKAKNELLYPDEVRPRKYRDEIYKRVYERYQEMLQGSHALDFDDLLMEAVRMFREDKEVLQAYRSRYQHVLVDEFQDTNTAQYEMVRLLGKEHRRVFIVGDEDQSIYRFRGADFRNVQRFRDDFPDARVVLLEENYRSTQTILSVANSVISKNTQRVPKQLFTRRDSGEQVVVKELFDEIEEADYVVKEAVRLTTEGYNLRDIAVMYRTNAQSRALEEALLREGIPYQLVGATRFYARREIKDVLAYLRILLNPSDDVSLLRIVNVPPRKIGAKTVAEIQRWARGMRLAIYPALQLWTGGSDSVEPPPVGLRAQKALVAFVGMIQELRQAADTTPVPDLITLLLDRTGYGEYLLKDGTEEAQERLGNVMELRNVATSLYVEPGEDPLNAFLERVALVSDVDNLPEERDGVTLLTLHTSKGLEFPVVFITGLEEGLMPHSRSVDDPDELEEERRLFYVGVTRAKDRLYLLHTFRRTRYGDSDVNEKSRFLKDIPPDLIEGNHRRGRSRDVGPFPQTRPAPPKHPTPTSVYVPGTRVEHPKYGLGTVVGVADKNGDQEVSVAFAGKGIKKFLASLAKLKLA